MVCLGIGAVTIVAKYDASKDSYMLDTGVRGAKALELQQQYMAEGSYAHLEKAGLKSEMIVCDAGCGSGDMTVYLAQKVGPMGRVYAVDVSKDQLDVTQRKVQAAGLNNVEFIQADIQKADQVPRILVDLVYTRLVLIHVSDQKQALVNLMGLLKPDGVLSVQETSQDTVRTSFVCSEFLEFQGALIKLGRVHQLDYNFGHRVKEVVEELGLDIVSYYVVQNRLEVGLVKSLLMLRIPEIAPKMLKAGLVSQPQLDKWIDEFRRWPEGDNHCVNDAEMVYMLIRKRNSM